MKVVFLAFVVFLSYRGALSQSVVTSPDSTRILFPNNVKVPIVVKRKGGSHYFELSEKAFRTVLAQADYLTTQSTLKSNALLLLRQEMVTLDSALRLRQTMFDAAQARAEVYRQSYNEMKLVNEALDTQFASIVQDLKREQAKNKKSVRRTFVKGAIAGVGCGVLVALVTLISTH
jgi:hypothetical protein